MEGSMSMNSLFLFSLTLLLVAAQTSSEGQPIPASISSPPALSPDRLLHSSSPPAPSPDQLLYSSSPPVPSPDQLLYSSSPPAPPPELPVYFHAGLIAGIAIAVVAITAVAATTFILFQRRKLKSKLKVISAAELDSTRLETYMHPSALCPIRYSYKQLHRATHNFDSSRLLGKGGCGPVYKGDIDKELIAVKCVNGNPIHGFKEFYAEITVMSGLRHRNLVQLRGWCYENDKYFLVYEHVANGSLDRILFNDKRCRNELSWQRRFRIVLDLAAAVQYLHEGYGNRIIIHRDIKTSNVLLDEKYVTKLGDFGLSRPVGGSHTPTTMVAGTQGYIAPEVFIDRKASKESDMYSFGVVLAEIACGKPAIDWLGMAVVDWVWDHLPAGMVIQTADERLDGQFNEDEMMRVLLLAIACSNPDPFARPSIGEALEILRGKAPLPDVPLRKPIPVYSTSSSTRSGQFAATPSSFGGGTTSTSSRNSSVVTPSRQPRPIDSRSFLNSYLSFIHEA